MVIFAGLASCLHEIEGLSWFDVSSDISTNSFRSWNEALASCRVCSSQWFYNFHKFSFYMLDPRIPT